MILGAAFLFGLVVGSFLNVCIVRLPEERSIVSPPSHCPRCREQIRWYDNIPVLSFLALRGRCRNCGLPISWRYPLVEVLNGLLWLWTVFEFGISGEALVAMALCSSLLVITFIDLDHQIIPDVITLPGMVIGLAVAPLFMTPLAQPLPLPLGRLLPHAGPYLAALLNSLIGLLAGGVPLLLIGWLWQKLRGVEAMGGGDVKLMGMVGSILGWQGAVMTVMVGAFAGSAVGITLIALKRQKADQHIPFGPFLALGALITLFRGFELRDWYLGMFGL
jgi:leader peptidase (prepilin peptidase)/N-methyltransferase